MSDINYIKCGYDSFPVVTGIDPEEKQAVSLDYSGLALEDEVIRKWFHENSNNCLHSDFPFIPVNHHSRYSHSDRLVRRIWISRTCTESAGTSVAFQVRASDNHSSMGARSDTLISPCVAWTEY